MSEILTVAGMVLISLFTILLLRQYKPEYAFGVSIVVGVILFFAVLSPIRELFSGIKDWLSFSSVKEEEYAILLRCFGICVITKITAQTCVDCNESSLASKVDLIGKISVLTVAFPLFNKLLGIVRELMI